MSIKKGSFRQLSSFFHNQENVVYLSVIVLAGTALRLYNLGTESFWFDEISTVYRAPQDLQTLVYQLVTQGNATRNAVYYLLAHFWVSLFGITEVSIRSLSVLFGVLSIVMMYLVGQKLFGEKVGLLSSFFMAVSEFQIQHSQEARFYSLFVLLTLISMYYYILALRTKQTRLWIVTSLVNTLLFYTHTYAVFVFAVEYVYYFLCWKNNKDTFVRWGAAQVLLALAIVSGFIPMLSIGSAADLGSGLAWITAPSFKDLMITVYGYLFPQNYQHSWFFIGSSFVMGTIFFIVGGYLLNFRRADGQGFEELTGWFQSIRFPPFVGGELALVALWFVCPVILPFIYSNFFSPIFVDRYTICAAPAFYLLFAVALSRLSRFIPIYISLVALLIVILPGLQDYYVADVNEQWHKVAAYVERESQPNDVIVFTPDDGGYENKSFDWYYQGSLPSCGISSNVRDDQTVSDILSNCTLGHDRFWVIMRGPSQVVNRFASFFLNLDQAANAHLIKEQQFVKVSVYLFELSK